ncbi:uncharacterized protein LOC142337081 [Convolutriloba macropyga]|uniref:uncharacterized protein LOC142337081 n=1 Tax=Convolutriloba macropyga TaxID=536237 RepID=UPI003F52208C
MLLIGNYITFTLKMKEAVFFFILGFLSFVPGIFGLNCLERDATNCTEWGCTNVNSADFTATTCGGSPTSPRCNTKYTYTTIDDVAQTSNNIDTYTVMTECADSSVTGYSCSFSERHSAVCNNYCTTDGCNDPYTHTVVTATATSCVQCTTESTTDGCYNSPPAATTCSSTSHQYCSTMHTVVLDSTGAVSQNVVFRGCSEWDHADGCWADSTQIQSNATLGTSVTCSKTCSAAGCNSDVLPFTDLKGSGTICKSCESKHGGCDANGGVSDITCLAGEEYCYSQVIYTDGDYYNAANDATNYGHEVEIIYEKRGCRSAAVTASCSTVTSDVAGSNLNVYSCEETCSGDKCNNEWPMRPRCSQCSGYYWYGGVRKTESDDDYITYCKETPPPPDKCPDPSYQYCYVSEQYIADGDNDVKWGYSQVFLRGCMKESAASKCTDYKWRDDREAHGCKFVCTADDCNLGSTAAPIALSAGALFVSLVATASALLSHLN